MWNYTGWLMIASLFIAIYFFTAKQLSYKDATSIYGVVIVIVVWLITAAKLIGNLRGG